MRMIARKILREFWEGHADAEQPLKAWFKLTETADWAKPSEVKKAFGSASIVGDNRVVFNIAGNKYRLMAKINYPYRVLYIRFIGTHRQYDAIDVTEV